MCLRKVVANFTVLQLMLDIYFHYYERDTGNGFLCWQAHIKNDEYFVPCMSKGSAGEIGDATS